MDAENKSGKSPEREEEERREEERRRREEEEEAEEVVRACKEIQQEFEAE